MSLQRGGPGASRPRSYPSRRSPRRRRPAAEPAASADREPTDAEKLADIDWQSYAERLPADGTRARRGTTTDRPSFEATLTRRATLAEHLDWQLQLSGFPAEEEAAAQLHHRQPRRARLPAVEPRGDRAPGRRAGGGGRASALATRAGVRSDRASARATCASACCSSSRALGIDDPIVLRDPGRRTRPAEQARLPGRRAPARHQRRGGRRGGAHRRPARAAARARLRRRRPDLHRARTSTSTRSATTSTSCSTRTGSRSSAINSLYRDVLARGQPDAARTPRTTSRRRCARRCG